MFKHKDTTAFTREKIEKTVKRVEELIDDTPESLDTLKEVADTISSMQQHIKAIDEETINTSVDFNRFKNAASTHYYIDGSSAAYSSSELNTFSHVSTADSVTMTGHVIKWDITGNRSSVRNGNYVSMWKLPVVTSINAGICTADMYNSLNNKLEPYTAYPSTTVSDYLAVVPSANEAIEPLLDAGSKIVIIDLSKIEEKLKVTYPCTIRVTAVQPSDTVQQYVSEITFSAFDTSGPTGATWGTSAKSLDIYYSDSTAKSLPHYIICTSSTSVNYICTNITNGETVNLESLYTDVSNLESTIGDINTILESIVG